jgi:hypothetical protein
MKTHIENYIYDDSHLGDINAIVGICTSALDENDLRERITHETGDWHIEGVCWGFGHNHFWLEEEHGSAGYKRILFVDFTNHQTVITRE